MRPIRVLNRRFLPLIVSVTRMSAKELAGAQGARSPRQLPAIDSLAQSRARGTRVSSSGTQNDAEHPKKKSSKERILVAFADLLREEGVSGATFEEVAHRAGISKSGVLHHFHSKEELIDALIDRLVALNQANIEQFGHAPGNKIAMYLRESMIADDEYSETFLAVSKLAGKSWPNVTRAMDLIVEAWHEALTQWTGDPVVARLVQLAADGLYLHTQLGYTPTQMDVRVAKLVRDLASEGLPQSEISR